MPLAEVMAGAGPVSAVASELKQLEEALADPARADEMESLPDLAGGPIECLGRQIGQPVSRCCRTRRCRPRGRAGSA